MSQFGVSFLDIVDVELCGEFVLGLLKGTLKTVSGCCFSDQNAYTEESFEAFNNHAQNRVSLFCCGCIF